MGLSERCDAIVNGNWKLANAADCFVGSTRVRTSLQNKNKQKTNKQKNNNNTHAHTSRWPQSENSKRAQWQKTTASGESGMVFRGPWPIAVQNSLGNAADIDLMMPLLVKSKLQASGNTMALPSPGWTQMLPIQQGSAVEREAVAGDDDGTTRRDDSVQRI